MRADGSLPLETARGARALWYQRHAVASLVVIAQMAAVQGIDLFGLQVDGRDLHLAIDFLLDGIEAAGAGLALRRAPTTIRASSAVTATRTWASCAPRPRTALHGMGRDLHGAFPRSGGEPPAVGRAQGSRSLTFRPMVDEYSGGNTTCYFAQR